ncbi:hypothetical protein [Lacipirellula sp.]|uniref:hypothetical protein n=1 Tax=Lacipirellula sp. TaxID=2691419 RepID=UPI003D0B6433
MNLIVRRAEFGGYAHNLYTHIEFEGKADRFLRVIKESPVSQADTKPMRKNIGAVVKDLSRLQSEFRKLHAAHLMPYYEALADALASLACETWACIEQLEANPESDD